MDPPIGKVRLLVPGSARSAAYWALACHVRAAEELLQLSAVLYVAVRSTPEFASAHVQAQVNVAAVQAACVG